MRAFLFASTLALIYSTVSIVLAAPTTAEFQNSLQTCAAGGEFEVDADLIGSVVNIYDEDRTEGKATINNQTTFLSLIPEKDRFKAYQLYVGCIKDILSTTESGGLTCQNAWATIASGHKKPGDLGRRRALETLNGRCNASLAGLDFGAADWAGRAVLLSLSLPGANLDSTRWEFADLSHANFESANLQRALLNSATLGAANLRGADLRSANLSYASLHLADLTNAKLDGANLTHVRYCHTRMPDGRIVTDSTTCREFGIDPVTGN